MNNIISDLIKKYNGIELTYENLPDNAKNAVNVCYREDFELDISDNHLFIYVEIPIEELKSAIGCPNDLPYKTFEEYHKWYMDGGDIPSHEDVWAIILSNDEDEIIFDGWHRFHSYVDKGINIIPCIYSLQNF